jgi:hypothetical protein
MVAVAILILLGGVFHRHESDADSLVCAACHAPVQTAIDDFSVSILARDPAPVEFICPKCFNGTAPNPVATDLPARAPPLHSL